MLGRYVRHDPTILSRSIRSDRQYIIFIINIKRGENKLEVEPLYIESLLCAKSINRCKTIGATTTESLLLLLPGDFFRSSTPISSTERDK